LAFCLFIIGPFLIVGWVSTWKTSDTIKNEVGKTMLQLVKQNHVTMENTLASVRDKTLTFLDNHFFSNTGQFTFWTRISTPGELSQADAVLDRWSSDGTEYSLYLYQTEELPFPVDVSYKSKGLIFLQEGTSLYPEWAEQTRQDKGAGSFRLAASSSGQATISYTRSILNPERYNEQLGFLVVSKLEVLLTKNLLSVQLPDGAATYLFNDRGELLMSAGAEEALEAGNAADNLQQGRVKESQAEAKKASAADNNVLSQLPAELRDHQTGYYYGHDGRQSYLYAISYNTTFNTRLLYKIPVQSITGNQPEFQRMIMIMLAVYLLFVLLFVLYLIRDIIKPLGRLVTFTRVYEPGRPFDFGGYTARKRTDEFGLLYDAFIRMTQRMDQSIEENYGMKIKQKEQELSTLHSQITPHLLYNTLDSIYWYALDSGNANVGSMVKDLSKLLRIGLSKGKSIITVKEELEHVQAYIRLQMQRYPGIFEVFWDIEEGMEDYTLPKVIIQPLVENAIFHGIQSMDGEGMLWIRIKRLTRSGLQTEGVEELEENHPEDITILIEDNGFIPVDLDKLEMIVRGELQDKGYGIRNVHQRIQLHYGEAYGLSYSLREGGGLVAAIALPARPHE
jgi:two-component system sensor histidine kinase YesM